MTQNRVKKIVYVLLFFTMSNVLCYWAKEYMDYDDYYDNDGIEYRHVSNRQRSKFHEQKSKKHTKKKVILYGPQELEDASFYSLDISGPVEFENLTITKSVTVRGPTRGNGLEAKKLTVFGPLDLTEAVLDSILVHGPCELEDVKAQSITIILNEGLYGLQRKIVLFFEEVVADTVIIKSDASKVTVEIRENSNINSLTFEGKKGTVITDESSTIDSIEHGKKIVDQEEREEESDALQEEDQEEVVVDDELSEE
jgi:hypothetical protein